MIFKNQFSLCCFAAWFFILPATALAQSTPGAAPEDLAAAQKKFDTASTTLRTTMKDAQRAGTLYFQSTKDDAKTWEQKWITAAELGTLAAADLRNAARTLVTGLAPDGQILAVARLLWIELFSEHQYEQAYQISRELIRCNPDQSDAQLNHARAAMLTNRFAEAQRSLAAANQPLKGLPDFEQALFSRLDSLIAGFEREQELRDAEAKADDLPRVEFDTTGGKIVIELFENEAPETVANFIHLVENKFYDETLFHHVVKNSLEMAVAQGGSFTMQSRKFLPWVIHDEFENEYARKNFRGVIGMANTGGKPNSASSQFYFTLLPLLHLDGHHTVFGRVISGIENLDKIKATVSINDKDEESAIEDIIPDKIIAARVLRKRNHVYEPTPVMANEDSPKKP